MPGGGRENLSLDELQQPAEIIVYLRHIEINGDHALVMGLMINYVQYRISYILLQNEKHWT